MIPTDPQAMDYGQTEAVPQPTILTRLAKIEDAINAIVDRLTEIDSRLDRLESNVGIDVGPVRR